jgi:hypothetical protein
LLLVLLAASSLGACGGEPSPDTSDERAKAPGLKDVNGSKRAPEELASIHEQSPVVAEALIRRYSDALARLQPHCREPQRLLG